MASLTNDIDLMDDEEEQKQPPSLTSDLPDFGQIFADQDALDTASRNFVPEKFLSTANKNFRMADEVRSGADKRFKPILEGMAKFRDDLEGHAGDVPPEDRYPFYGGQKIEDPDTFMREVDANFEQWNEEKDDWFGADKAKRAMSLKGTWDGWKAKYSKAKSDMDTAQALADEHQAVRDQLTVQYLSVGESQRQALQDVWDMQNPDKATSSSARSRLTALNGFDPYALVHEAGPYANRVAQRRKRVHAEMAYDAAKKKEYAIAQALDKQGMSFSKNGYFAGRPLNVNKNEHGILADLDDTGEAATTAKYGLENVQNAQFAQAFFHSFNEYRTSRMELMVAKANKDPEAIKEANAGILMNQAAFTKKVAEAHDQDALGGFLGRVKSEDEFNLIRQTMHSISQSPEAQDMSVFGRIWNGAKHGLEAGKQSWSKGRYDAKNFVGLGSKDLDQEFAEAQREYAVGRETDTAAMDWRDIEGPIDAAKWSAEFATTMGVQMAMSAPVGVASGGLTAGTGAVLEKIGKSNLLKRWGLLRAAVTATGKALQTKKAVIMGSSLPAFTHMELGGSYIEAMGAVKTDKFPKGVDMLNAEQQTLALQDPEVLNQVNRAAYGRAATIAAVESMTFMAAGAASGLVKKAIGTGVGSTVLPAMARVGTDAVVAGTGEIAGMGVMHQTMGMEGPFVTINQGKDGWEVGGYVGDNIEDVILEMAGGTVVDAYQTGVGKAYEFTADQLTQAKEKHRKAVTDRNFQQQVAKLAEETAEIEKGTASSYVGSEIVESENETAHGTTGILDTGRGKKHEFHTFKDNTALLGILTDRLGGDAISTRQFKFLESFFDQMEATSEKIAGLYGTGKNDWKSMKLVFTNEMEDNIKDSPAAFHQASNTLFINTGEEFGMSNFGAVTTDRATADGNAKEVMGLVSNIVHEVGHFSERYVVGDAKAKEMFEAVDTNAKGADGKNQGMFVAHMEYSLKTRARAEKSPEAWAQERDAFYKKYKEDDAFAAGVKSEWFAFQFSRVARDQTEGMDKGVKGVIKRLLQVFRKPYNDMVGDKRLSNQEIDAEISTIFQRDMDDVNVGLSEDEQAERNRLRTSPVTEPIAETETGETTAPEKKKDKGTEATAEEIDNLPSPSTSTPKSGKKKKKSKKAELAEIDEALRNAPDEKKKRLNALIANDPVLNADDFFKDEKDANTDKPTTKPLPEKTDTELNALKNTQLGNRAKKGDEQALAILKGRTSSRAKNVVARVEKYFEKEGKPEAVKPEAVKPETTDEQTTLDFEGAAEEFARIAKNDKAKDKRRGIGPDQLEMPLGARPDNSGFLSNNHKDHVERRDAFMNLVKDHTSKGNDNYSVRYSSGLERGTDGISEVDGVKYKWDAKDKKWAQHTDNTLGALGVRQVFAEKKSARIKTLASKSLPDRLRKKLAEAPSSKTEAEVLGKEVWERYLAQATAKIEKRGGQPLGARNRGKAVNEEGTFKYEKDAKKKFGYANDPRVLGRIGTDTKESGSHVPKRATDKRTQEQKEQGRGEVIELTHYTTGSETHEVLKTKEHGTGIAGAERMRKADMPKLYVDRIYFGDSKYKPEKGLNKKSSHHVRVDKGNMFTGTPHYDTDQFVADFEKFAEKHDTWPSMRPDVPGMLDNEDRLTAWEAFLKDQGYVGVYNEDANVGYVFYDTAPGSSKKTATTLDAPYPQVPKGRKPYKIPEPLLGARGMDKETGYRAVKGKDVAGRDIPEWGGAVVAHSTDIKGLQGITKEGYRTLGEGDFGRAVSFTIDKQSAKNFGNHMTTAQIAEDAKILNLNDAADWAKFTKITGGRVEGQHVRDQLLKAGYDGVYDAGAGDLFLHNPRKAQLLGSRGILGSASDGTINYADHGSLDKLNHRDGEGVNWRYREDEQSLFFWSEPSEADRTAIKDYLAKKGFKVERTRVLDWMDEDNDMRLAHGLDAQDVPDFYKRKKAKSKPANPVNYDEDAFAAFADMLVGDRTKTKIPEEDTLGARSVVWSKYDALEYSAKNAGDTATRLKQKKNKKPSTGVATNDNLTFNDGRGRTIHIGADAQHGGKPFAAWVQENDDWLSSQEIDDFSSWYKNISGQFTKVFGKEGTNIMVAWLSSQQNVSPTGGMANVFKVQDLLDDIIYRNPKTKEAQKGGLAHDKIVAVLTEQMAEKGFAGKLTDFVDAGLGKMTRTYMGDDPSAGQPFVADIHSGVDSGHVNHQTLTRLMKMADGGKLFVGPDKVSYTLKKSKKVKKADGKTAIVPNIVEFNVNGQTRKVVADQHSSPSDNVYEGISEWGNNLTDYLNKIGWKGKQWDASMAQAVGWMRVLKAYDMPMGDSMSSITENTSSVYAEVNYSSGQRLQQVFPSLQDEKGKPTKASRKINNYAMPKIAKLVAKAVGGSIRIRGTQSGTGVWKGDLADMTGIEMLGSDNARQMASLALAWATEQGAAMGVVFGKGGKAKRAVTFERADGKNLTEAQRRSIAKHLNEANIRNYDGGLSVARLNGQREGVVSGLTPARAAKVQQSIFDWAKKNKVQLVGSDVASETNYYELPEGQTFQDKPGGLGYLHEIERLGGASKIPAILGLRQEYAVLLEKAHQKYNKEQLAGTTQERVGFAGALPKGDLGKFHPVAIAANLPLGARPQVAPVNVFDMPADADVMGHQSRVMGARPAQVIAGVKAHTKATVSASAQILLDDSITFVERLGQLGNALSGLVVDPIRIKMQDKLLPVRRLLEEMEDTRGGTFDDKYQTYVKHENMAGKTGAELNNWAERHERPLAEKVAEKGVMMEALDDFLHIRHAKERNLVDRDLHTEHFVLHRNRRGAISKKAFGKGVQGLKKARKWAKGYVVTWDNTDQHGNVTTMSREVKDQKKADKLVKKMKNRPPRANGIPYHSNVTQTHTTLPSHKVSSSSKVNEGSGYADEVADAAMQLDRAELHRLNAQGKLSDAGLDRMDRMIDAMHANPGGKQAYEDVAKLVDKMNRESLKRQHESGLIGDKDFKRIKNAYKHYVPLRGWDEVSMYYDASANDVQDLLNNNITPISSGVNTIKHAFKGSTGLKEGTTVANHLAYSMAMARQGIVESQKNQVMRSFFEVVEMARKDKKLGPMAKNFFSYNTIPKIQTVVNGVARTMIDPKWKDDPNVIGMKINGQTVAIRLMPDRADGTSSVARALKNLGAEKSTTFVNFVKGYTRFMASVRTTFSPAFTFTNFVKDMGTALYAIKGFESDFKRAIKNGDITKDQVKHISDDAVRSVLNFKTLRKALLGALDHSTGGRGLSATKFIPGVRNVGQKARQDPEVQKWAKIFKDFSDNGGRINFFGFDSVQDMAKKFGVAVKDFDPTNENKFKNFVKNGAEVMEQMSGAVENLTRVVVYDSLVRNGLSKQQAANMALNLTTNFTRKGEMTTGLNAMYLFFNAGVQGSYKILSVAGQSANARKVLGAMVGVGFTTAVLNRIFSDDDEETGESAWDGISPHSKTHNLHLFLPGTGEGHVKMPTPYGLNVFTAMGTMMADVMFGKTRLGDAATTVAATAVESFSPIGGSSMASAITPTAFQPFTDLMLNKDFAGRPIYKENMSVGPQLPDSSLYYSNVTGISKMAAKTLNKIFGGDEFRPGAVDMSPHVLDYMANYFLGGFGSFLGRTSDGAAKAFLPGEPWPQVNDVPIVRRFIGSRTVWSDSKRFYDLVNHIGVSKKRVEGYRAHGDTDALMDVQRYEAPRLRMKSLWDKQVQKQLTDIRKELVVVENSKTMSGTQKQRRTDVLKGQRSRIMNRFVMQAERLGIDDY